MSLQFRRPRPPRSRACAPGGNGAAGPATREKEQSESGATVSSWSLESGEAVSCYSHSESGAAVSSFKFKLVPDSLLP